MSGRSDTLSKAHGHDPLLLNASQGFVARLDAFIDDAVKHVPFYADRLASSRNGNPGRFRDLRPVTKSELVRTTTLALTNSRFDAANLRIERTTGSSGQPFSVAMHRSYLLRRNWRFLRALLDVGYRPGQRVMLVARTGEPTQKDRFGWCYARIDQPVEMLYVRYQAIKPSILYGCVTPLRLLAEYARKNGKPLHRPNLVITTAEGLTDAAHDHISREFQAPVSDFYGCTEMGLVAWKRPGAAYYETFDNSIAIELAPYSPNAGWYQLILTNLELRSMPILRLQIGDLAEVRAFDSTPRIVRFQGREIDALIREDEVISPYAVTTQLEKIEDLNRFQLTQVSPRRFDVDVECDAGAKLAVAQQIKSCLRETFGNDIEIALNFVDKIPVEMLRKFRPIRSLVGRQE
tara:strand:+ start:21563 stop:22777 length:1215 start_codon:yes stop_codon:yes gene_type:complete